MNKFSLAVKILALCSAINITTAQAEDLVQVYRQAKGYDAQLQSQEMDYLATLENRPQALAGKNPQVSLRGSASVNKTYFFQDASIFDDSLDSNTFNSDYALNLTKSLYNVSIDRQVEQANAVIAQAYSGLEQQRQLLMMNVARRYFDFLLAQDTMQFLTAEKQNTQRQLAQVDAFFEAGRSAITDVREAKARYDLVLSQEVSAAQALAVAREALRVLTGVAYEKLSPPVDDITLTMPEPQSIEAWIERAKENNKVLQAQYHAIETARAALNVQRATNTPKVDLFARHTGSLVEGNIPLDPRSVGLSVGVEASMPFYTGGATASKIRQAKQQLGSAEQQYEYQRRLIEEQVRSAYLSVNSAIALARANQQALVSAQTAAEATQLGFEVGARTAVDILTARRNVFSAQRDYATARYTYLVNILNLKLAAGTLSEADIVALNQLLTNAEKTKLVSPSPHPTRIAPVAARAVPPTTTAINHDVAPPPASDFVEQESARPSALQLEGIEPLVTAQDYVESGKWE